MEQALSYKKATFAGKPEKAKLILDCYTGLAAKTVAKTTLTFYMIRQNV